METTLQVPISKSLRNSATAVARDYGFSSLQELVRLMLNKLARREIGVNVVEQFPPAKLSKRNERRYAKMEEDFRKGKNIYTASSVEEFLKQLRS